MTRTGQRTLLGSIAVLIVATAVFLFTSGSFTRTTSRTPAPGTPAVATPTPFPTPATKTFGGDTYPQLQVTVPPGWRTKDGPRPLVLVVGSTQRDQINGTPYASTVQVNVTTPSPNATGIATYENSGTQSLEKSFPGIRFGEPQRTTIGPWEAVSFEGSGETPEHPGTPFHVLASFVPLDPQTLILAVGVTLESSWTRDGETVRTAITSLKPALPPSSLPAP